MGTPVRAPRGAFVSSLHALVCGIALAGTLVAGPATAQEPKVVTVASGLDDPWGLAFLPGGRMLVTEKVGRMRIVEPDGKLGEPLAGIPEVASSGQGGLLDVALDPKFADNRLVYWSYSEPGDGGAGTAVARGRLDANRLADVQVIFRQVPKTSGGLHFGSRLVFARDGRLFVTTGDRGRLRDEAQNLGTHIGKVIRIESDGEVPADNPFVGRAGARPEVYSYGHRNLQGAALHPETGALWTNEHGPQGGDELNLVESGRNYGWPVITQGREYGIGAKIGEGTARADIAAASQTWVPSIAPSGLAFVEGERYPGWRGNALVGALKGQMLVRLELDGRKVVREHRLLQSLGERIRDVVQAPDGWIYLLTDSANGRILRLMP